MTPQLPPCARLFRGFSGASGGSRPPRGTTIASVTVRRDDGYEITTDPGRIDTALVHRWLSTDAYWALGRSRETVERSMAASLNFGVLGPRGDLAGYARVVTDRATFAWLCDVYVPPHHRGAGLGTWLVHTVRAHLAPHGVKRVLLATADAHGVYAKAGFTPCADPAQLMELDLHAAGPGRTGTEGAGA